jgi:hypothetical protein
MLYGETVAIYSIVHCEQTAVLRVKQTLLTELPNRKWLIAKMYHGSSKQNSLLLAVMLVAVVNQQ